MSKKRKKAPKEPETEMRVSPENRVCPQFDPTGIDLFPQPDRGEMGVRVVDDCAVEHIM